MISHKCLGEGCQKMITYRFAICASCEKIYGSKPLEWPEWLRYLWNEEQRERRKQKNRARVEVNMDTDLLQELVGEEQENISALFRGINDE